MTPAQKIAIEHPCYLAQECQHPMFRRKVRNGAGLILTFNAGYE